MKKSRENDRFQSDAFADLMRPKPGTKAQNVSLGELLLNIVILTVLSFNYSVMHVMSRRHLFPFETSVLLNAAQVS